MGIIEFLGLSEPEQWDEFSEHCVFIAKYQDVDVHHNLFLVHDFFVELTSDSGIQLYQSMNAFLYGERLDKYMENDLIYIAETLKLRND